ncbi:LmbE-like protein [Candidatus Paraburkholderia kirkii]|nr:LmbE-like protein [Candidatus Paraburkholderia kirkii]
MHFARLTADLPVFIPTKPRRAGRSIARSAHSRGGRDFMASVSARAPTDPSVHDRTIASDGTPEAAWQEWQRLDALPEVASGELVPLGARAVVVAPHPDDEVLGIGGLLARLSEISRNILIIAVTDGTASHPDSRDWPPERLASVRPQETREALQRLHLRQVQVVRLGLKDGDGKHFDPVLSGHLSRYLQPGDIVFVTWRYDGHPDHEAAGRAVHSAASALACRAWKCPSGLALGVARRYTGAMEPCSPHRSFPTNTRTPGSFEPCRLSGASSNPTRQQVRRRSCPNMCWPG